jgi:hypothetical protein
MVASLRPYQALMPLACDAAAVPFEQPVLVTADSVMSKPIGTLTVQGAGRAA